MHNTFRIKNNHVLYHAVQFQQPLQIILLNPLDKNPRTQNFFQKEISNIKESLAQFSDDITIMNQSKIDSIVLSSKTHVVMDMYYLNEEKVLYDTMLELVRIHESSFDLVETNTLVPVTEASTKQEYSARTIRTKIHKQITNYLDPVFDDIYHIKGEIDAEEKLHEFLTKKLEHYQVRNNPAFDVTSSLSPYLKYGFISPLTIYLRLKELPETDNLNMFIEELIVRRELAYNFISHNSGYDCFETMTYEWAYITMRNHVKDKREYLYTLDDYILFKTHDPYFNTAMKEMVYFGKMHGYMRMYWAKKIIEWSKNYKEAYSTILYLNNYYFIDGNTPNGYTGVAWCFGQHDRAWKERPIFGKLRYMNKNGLDRKFDMEKYIDRIDKDVLLYEI